MARINKWNPEDDGFWQSEGKKHAKRIYGFLSLP